MTDHPGTFNPYATASPPRLDPSQSIRRQLVELMEDVGVDPNRFLVPPKDPDTVCFSTETSRETASEAAKELSKLLMEDTSHNISPVLLRFWIQARWDKIAPLAHIIHNERKD